MATVEAFNNQYWFYEMEIAKIADVFGITREQLIQRIEEFPIETRRYVFHALNMQKDILYQGNKMVKCNIATNDLVSLDEYRKYKL